MVDGGAGKVGGESRGKCLALRSLWWVGVLCFLWVVHLESARASTIAVSSHPEPVYGDEVVYHAARGERNHVTLQEVSLSGSASSVWEVRDSGAVITATAPCAAVDAHTARCTGLFFPNPIGGYRVRLGDGDDTLSVVPTTASTDVGWVVVDGGAGDDVLFGGKTDFALGDILSGGGGTDELHGGPGPDELSDGDRSHGSSGARAPDRDILDGGSGVDTVSYRQRTAPVEVDLADKGGDGERGERDALTGIESIVGGQARDRLAGDARANSIDGAGDSDRLIGRGGDDVLISGATNKCGAGRDTVRTDSLFYGRDAWLGLLERDCESIDPIWSNRLEANLHRVNRRGVSYRVVCPIGDVDDEDATRPCAGRLQLREHTGRHRLLARGRLPKRAWAPGWLRARYTVLGRQLALSGRSLKVDMTFAGFGMTFTGARFPATAHWTIRLAFGR